MYFVPHRNLAFPRHESELSALQILSEPDELVTLGDESG